MASDNNPPDGESKVTPQRTRQYLRKARQIGLEAHDGEHAAQLLEGLNIDVLKDDVSLIDVGGAGDGDNVITPTSGAGMSEQVSANFMLNDAERLAEVHAIQRDLIRRRRVRLFWLMLRICMKLNRNSSSRNPRPQGPARWVVCFPAPDLQTRQIP